MFKFILATVFLSAVLSAPADDLVNVSMIPGYLQNPNFTTYSGYLSLNQFYNTTKEMHYVFVTSINNPQTDPLLLWLNGGPGCSSLEGWLSEIGPCVFDDSMTALNGSFNPYTWAQNASLLFLEAPAGVGFSWVADEKEESYNDNVTTTDMYLSLQAWFKEYPEWNNHYFYIAGESYAGIYIPRLASRIIQENANTSNTGYQNINLTGIMVGNGVTIQDTLTFTGPEYLYYHNLIPGDLYNRFYDACTANINSAECNETQSEISDLTSTVNPYDIYRYCYNDYTTGGACATALGWSDLLRTEPAMEALHVTEYNITWSDCSDYIGDVYVPIQPGSLSDYFFLKDKIKILVYSGDADSVVPFTDTYGWIYSNFNVIKDAQVWSAVPGQQAGLITIFDGIIYATVRGAGHMVPAWRRLQAYTMFVNYVHNISPFVWQP